MRVISVVFLIFFLLLGVANASEPYKLTNAVIDSFVACRIADDRLKQSLSQTLEEEGDSILLLMKDVIVFNNEVSVARKFIEPFLDSKNELIKITANSYNTIFLMIINNNNNFIKLFEDALNSHSQCPLGTFTRKISENLAANQEGWKMLLYATAMLSHCLVDTDREKDGHLQYLNISKDERKAIIKSIEDSFGNEVKGGTKAGQLPIMASVSMLWEFLNKGWKTSDEN